MNRPLVYERRFCDCRQRFATGKEESKRRTVSKIRQSNPDESSWKVMISWHVLKSHKKLGCLDSRNIFWIKLKDVRHEFIEEII